MINFWRVSELLSDCCQIMQLYHGKNKLHWIRWCTLCTRQHTYLDFYSTSSLKQQTEDRHVAPLGHIILIPTCYSIMLHGLTEKQQIPILKSLVWTEWGSNPWSIALEASMLNVHDGQTKNYSLGWVTMAQNAILDKNGVVLFNLSAGELWFTQYFIKNILAKNTELRKQCWDLQDWKQ